jgi:hypothetical protein
MFVPLGTTTHVVGEVRELLQKVLSKRVCPHGLERDHEFPIVKGGCLFRISHCSRQTTCGCQHGRDGSLSGTRQLELKRAAVYRRISPMLEPSISFVDQQRSSFFFKFFLTGPACRELILALAACLCLY